MKRIALVHGFLGSPADWADVLAALAPDIACDVVSLREFSCSTVIGFAEALNDRLRRTPSDLVVGYSLGARIALEACAINTARTPKLLLLSTQPGMRDASERAMRAASDLLRSDDLLSIPTADFIERWYQSDLFASFRAHPSFDATRARRAQGDANFWSEVVYGCSPGRSESRWDALAAHASRITMAAGESDARYAAIVREAEATMPALTTRIVPNAGHVLPLEAPRACAQMIEQILHSSA